MVEKNILIKYFNERNFVYYNNEKGISSIRWKLNDRGKKRIEEFKKELKEYAKNHDYAKFNKEVTWIENFKVNTSNENNTLWVTDFLSSEDEIDYHMLKKDYVGYSVGIVSPDGDSLDYNLNASWTAFIVGEIFGSLILVSQL